MALKNKKNKMFEDNEDKGKNSNKYSSKSKKKLKPQNRKESKYGIYKYLEEEE